MSAMVGVIAIFGAYICAGWLGYQLGVERGVKMERTKRGIRRG